MLKNLKDWQQRVVDERDALQFKYASLQEYISSGRALEEITLPQLDLLQTQEAIMRSYLVILNVRIAQFTEE